MVSGRSRRRGFALAATAVCLPVMIAAVGLVVDAGRMIAAKSELQAFSDTAALAAAAELDGTGDGIDRARAIALSGPAAGGVSNRWLFSSQAVTGVQAGFARAPAGPFEAFPSSASGYRFVRVAVTQEISLYFLPVLPDVSARQPVTASAVAGQARQNSIRGGLAPFSPDAHDPSDPNFGFVPGRLYTLKWAPPGQRKNNVCPGDEDFEPAGGAADRGYLDLGQGNSNRALHNAIVNNEFYLQAPYSIGTRIDFVPGNKHVGPAMEERFSQDTDRSATAYADYQGNGRRLIIVAVNDHTDPGRVIGFGLFFLPKNACGTKNISPCCAEYVGPAVIGSRRAGAGPAGLYSVRLFQ